MANTTITITPVAPVVTVAKFAELTGIPEGTINQRIAEGKYPIMPKSKQQERPQINLVAFYAQCAKAANL